VSKEAYPSRNRLQSDLDQWRSWCRDWIAGHGVKGLERLREVFYDLLDGAVPRDDGNAIQYFFLVGQFVALQDLCEEEAAKDVPLPDDPS
jgi:hypothetical protein